MPIPLFTERTPNKIVIETNFFESSGRAYKALSWLGFAKSHKRISALQYAALEMRELRKLYANDDISIKSAMKRADILEPELKARLTLRST